MNYKMIFYVIGNLMKVEAIILLLPFLVSIIYQEHNIYIAFIVPIFLLLSIGILLTSESPKDKSIQSKEGLFIVAISWIIMSLFGALPFYISREIPGIVDCLFETVSGFTTTGSTILSDIETMSKGLLFWRSFTHWIGGMGALVFVLAILPQTGAYFMHIMRAEVPGPTVGKIVSKVRVNARILYSIYIFLTLLEILCLVLAGMPLFDSILNSLSTAGTGGFSLKNSSIAFYQSPYIETIISVFMVLFGINFNVFYLILIKKFSTALKSSELKIYLSIIAVSVFTISLNILPIYKSIWQSLRYAFFQVSSIMSTTGFISADYEGWPVLSQCILVLLMFCGACSGSTCGGIKISRLVIILKTVLKEIKKMLNPKAVISIKFDGKIVSKEVIDASNTYFVAYMLILLISTFIISFDNLDLLSSITASITCINNVGPGLGFIGPVDNFSLLSAGSKLTLCFVMIAGRLEIFPLLMLFFPSVWKVKK